MQQNTLVTRPLLRALGVNDELSQRNFAFLQLFTVYVSEAQIEALQKAVKFGWRASKIVYSQEKGVCAVGIAADGCAAWMTPDGKIERAAAGKKTAYLSSDWKEVA